MIIFASEVAKWHWGAKQPQEWGKFTVVIVMDDEEVC
jgi:hypothetical protein